MICRDDRDGEMTFANRTCLDILGYREYEALGADFDELIHPRDRPEVLKARELYLSRPATFRCRYRLLMGGGEYREIIDICRPTFDAGGKLVGHIESCRVITDRERADRK